MKLIILMVSFVCIVEYQRLVDAYSCNGNKSCCKSNCKIDCNTSTNCCNRCNKNCDKRKCCKEECDHTTSITPTPILPTVKPTSATPSADESNIDITLENKIEMQNNVSVPIAISLSNKNNVLSLTNESTSGSKDCTYGTRQCESAYIDNSVEIITILPPIPQPWPSDPQPLPPAPQPLPPAPQPLPPISLPLSPAPQPLPLAPQPLPPIYLPLPPISAPLPPIQPILSPPIRTACAQPAATPCPWSQLNYNQYLQTPNYYQGVPYGQTQGNAFNPLFGGTYNQFQGSPFYSQSPDVTSYNDLQAVPYNQYQGQTVPYNQYQGEPYYQLQGYPYSQFQGGEQSQLLQALYNQYNTFGQAPHNVSYIATDTTNSTIT